jgi:hypothetical protein
MDSQHKKKHTLRTNFGNPRSRESKQNPNPVRVCESFQREERDKGIVTREEITYLRRGD